MTDKKKNKNNQHVDNQNIDVKDNMTEQPIDSSADELCEKDNENNEPIEETAKLTDEINTLKEQLEKERNDYLRLMAEFDNYRKRTLREKADLIKSGGENCMKAILPIIDDFERALQAVDNSNDVAALKEGVDMIYHKFVSYLEQNGVKEMETIGCDFDADKHEAIAQMPTNDPDQKGKIIDCTQKGYTLNDMVIRYPKVVVAQ